MKPLNEDYGGSGEFTLPADHRPGMAVPKGGSSCAKCKFFSKKGDENHCGSEHFIKWNGSPKIPTDDPTAYCSDWYEMGDKSSKNEALDRLREMIRWELGKRA